MWTALKARHVRAALVAIGCLLAAGSAPPRAEATNGSDDVEALRSFVSHLASQDFRPTWRRELLSQLEGISHLLARHDACAASDGVLATLGDVDGWRAEVRRSIEAPPSRHNEIVPQERRLAVLADLRERLLRLRVAVLGERAPGVGCGGGATVAVDPLVVPFRRTVPGFGPGEERPVAALQDSRGGRSDFMENELLLASDDPAEASRLAVRWDAQVLDTREQEGTFHSLIRVGSLGVDTQALPGLLARLRPGQSEAIAVSSEAARRLLAVAALEAAAGSRVGINFVGEGLDIAAGTTLDAPTGPDDWDATGAWTGDAFNWLHFRRDSTQGIGVPEAWRLMERTRGTDLEPVGIGIIDMGFRDIDMPPDTLWRSMAAGAEGLGSENRYGCSGGNPCPWHGTVVGQAAAAALDNGLGGAGTAGRWGRLVNVYTLYDAWSALIGMDEARRNGVRVINMSFSNRVPSIFDWGLAASRAYTAELRDTVLFAAAGNSNEDVDALECFGDSCWENHFHWPCESEKVICVGGLAQNSLDKQGGPAAMSGSNYGDPERESDGGVDIYAPYTVLAAGSDPTMNVAIARSGTSVSSPYLAGVAALMRAADPDLSKDDLERTLYDTARRDSPHPRVHRIVDALAAVGAVLPQTLRIEAPPSGTRVRVGRTVTFEAFTHRVILSRITWTSSLDGSLGTGRTIVVELPTMGEHLVTARVTGTSLADSVRVNVVGPPTVEILAPAEGAQVGAVVNARAVSFDPATGAPLPDDGVRWFIARDFGEGFGTGSRIGDGHSATLDVSFLDPGETAMLRFYSSYDENSEFVMASIPITRATESIPRPTIRSPGQGAGFGIDGQDESGRYALVTLCAETETAGDPAELFSMYTWTTRRDGGPAEPLRTFPGGTGVGRDCPSAPVRLYTNGGTVTEHRITVTVTRGGRSGSDTVVVRITDLI